MVIFGENDLLINPEIERLTGMNSDECRKFLVEKSYILSYVKSKGGFGSVDWQYQHSNGNVLWLHCVFFPINHDDQRYNYICIIEDITQKRMTEDELRNSEKEKRLILNNLPGMAYRCLYDGNWTMSFISEGCFKLTGYLPEDFIDNKTLSYNDIIVSEHRRKLWDIRENCIEKKSMVEKEYEIITKSGEIKWVFERGQAVFDDNGNVAFIYGLIFDVTDKINSQQELKTIYERDQLSGLYNRGKLFVDMNEDLLTKASSTRALIHIKLRRIDLALSIYGYRYMESLIGSMADDLLMMCDNFIPYSIAFDKFVLYSSSSNSHSENVAFCDRLINWFKVEYSSDISGVEIGVYEDSGEEKNDPETMLKYASLAGNACDKKAFASYHFFDSQVMEKFQKRNILFDEIRSAAYEYPDKIVLQYQPIWDINNDKLIGYEGLARLNGTKTGLVPPNEFIPLAEQDRYIVPIGETVIRKSLRFLLDSKKVCPDIYISINISPKQLAYPTFLDDIKLIFKEEGANFSDVIFEVTESAFDEKHHTMQTCINNIRKLGIRVAIDDFGTGYSSLSREMDLIADYIKIDRIFINKLLHADESASITSDIISMSKKMGSKVIAEGIEEQKQLDYLRKYGCEFGQGYYYAKPLSKDDAIEMLKQNRQTHSLV